ncbi:acyl-CoA thioesterase [Bacillus cytotoxicus]|uniref:Thioesterase superfamily protein n=2 Tax=Bacillus cytotoxicus TaxID=580165 RepID=A0AAX2CLA9_9BACI|nr:MULTISPECIES: thioesterase family protein [Bacillus cereus group]ABS23435.1 thioesterase superfamily protein [Bacillus cytotoxicus NVH 391-98]AWC30038.1 acyl-CoA thioesterase [Bacillus cytotoxicus]AWC34084.1 acyl-CoA thioesterase [Bacillus cytotoxicus]AWC38081.1 acyl-CoA thioesterase [Bacillus cytotoxicus]AWC42174.1 acyl-CoA thioesterase [Bacillus cytotoxicus]
MKQISYIEDFEKWECGFSFYIPVKVRFGETDMFGHMNNSVAFTYFEEARIEFFKELGFMQEWTHKSSETMIVVADLQCNFLKQIFFDEHLKVYVKAGAVGNSSLDLHYMVKNESGEICLVGRGAMVQVSKKTGKGESWFKEWKQKLLQK